MTRKKRMTTITTPSSYFDFRNVLTKKKITGIWRMMTDYRLIYLAANLSLAISAVSKTLTYILLRNFADTMTGARTPFTGSLSTTLIVIALGFVGLAIIEGSFAFITGRLAAFSAEGITRRLRNFLYDHIQRLSFAYHSKTPTGDLIERVTSDVDSVRSFFNEQAIGIGRILLLFVINFIAIWELYWKLALASIAAIPVILAVSVWFFGRITKAYEKYQEQEAKLSTTLQENLTGVRVVKALPGRTMKRINSKRTIGKNSCAARNYSRCIRFSGLFQTLFAACRCWLVSSMLPSWSSMA